jgi:ribosome biogenesis GTPase
VQAAVDDGRLAPERLASHRKLERELAYAERRDDPRGQAEERRRWRAIHKAVDRHMDRKYGGEWR